MDNYWGKPGEEKLEIMKILLSLLIISLPLYVIRFNIAGFPTTFLEILILATFGIWLWQKSRRRQRTFMRTTGFEKPIILFLLVAAISLLVTPDKRGGLGIFKAYFLEPILVFYMVVDVCQQTKSWRWIINALVISGIWISFLSFLQIILGKFSLAPWELSQGRASAVYNSANMVSLYLGPIIALVAGELIRKGKAKRIFFSSLPIMLLAVFLSRSKGGIISLLLLGVFYFWKVMVIRFSLRWQKILKISLSVLLAGLLLTGVYILSHYDLTPPVPQGPPYQGGDTLLIRFYIWEGTIKMLKDHPFFGAGLDGFKEVYWPFHVREYWEEVQYPHNFLLTVWSELGILGLFAFGFLIYIFFKKIEAKGKKELALGLAGAMVYILIHGLVDVPYFKNDLSLEFWLLMALAAIKD